MTLDRAELVRLKLPIIQQDYQSHFHSASRLYDNINQLRALEVTVIAAFIALTSRDQSSEVAALVAGMMFLIGVGILDAMARIRIFYIGEAVQIVEALLQEADPQVFEENVLTWTFGN